MTVVETPLPQRFRACIQAGRDHLWAHVLGRDPARQEFWVFVLGYLGRVIRRFERLHALWLAGRLPVPQRRVSPSGRARAAPGERGQVPHLQIPNRRMWLVRLVQPMVRMVGPVEQLMNDPAMRAFIAECPGARRLLRGLHRAVEFPNLPAILRPVPCPQPCAAPRLAGARRATSAVPRPRRLVHPAMPPAHAYTRNNPPLRLFWAP